MERPIKSLILIKVNGQRERALLLLLSAEKKVYYLRRESVTCGSKGKIAKPGVST